MKMVLEVVWYKYLLEKMKNYKEEAKQGFPPDPGRGNEAVLSFSGDFCHSEV